MGRGNPLPVTVTLWNFGDEGRNGCSVGTAWRRDDKSNEASYCCGCNREKCKGFQALSFQNVQMMKNREPQLLLAFW